MNYGLSSVKFSASRVKIFVLLAILFAVFTAKAQDAAEGEKLFKQNCTSCHAVKKQVVGPALKGVETRWADPKLLIKFIQQSQDVIKGGDAYSNELFKKYNQTVMPNHGFLTDANVQSILAYVKAEGDKPDEVAKADAAAPGAEAGEDADEISDLSIWLLVGGIALLIIIIMVINSVVGSLERLIKQKNGEEITEEDELNTEVLSGFKKFWNNKTAVMITVAVFVIGLSVVGYRDLMDIGVEQGYQPKQPIAFSHQLHAGTYQINCQYCHSGAYKSKNASIPSANVCMNCHKYVQLTEKYDGQISPEISKIYKALDYNPTTQQYGPNQQPIEWVRVHNLQDFVYFPHANHVKVAGIACQKCHGPVQTMKEVYQYSPLTMGWCVNCHRETEMTHAKDNAYYERLIKAHEMLKKGEKMTVATVGGLECAKCHY